ncbi:hypothetical protein NMYAN_150056 [Nitrosomonas nitrosa]|uniref:Uncharacterized protein n=1 Tax=Nitrosomonas nitrosa TaxID=52442 RepID=A0A8H8YZ16_9PROT|nr:hypothetical protein NMYAN_150056 [Nitrosomonas nitrosa]
MDIPPKMKSILNEGAGIGVLHVVAMRVHTTFSELKNRSKIFLLSIMI